MKLTRRQLRQLISESLKDRLLKHDMHSTVNLGHAASPVPADPPRIAVSDVHEVPDELEPSHPYEAGNTHAEVGEVHESFWRAQQKRDRQEQLPEDTQAAKHIMLDVMREERPGQLGNVWSLHELTAIVSDIKGKDMKPAVKAALKLLIEEDRVRWEGARSRPFYFLNLDKVY
jgi:hypothetical protein